MLSPDFTMNSRVLLNDILSYAISQGLVCKINHEVLETKEINNVVSVKTSHGEYFANNVVISSPDAISKILGTPIKKGYAPMAIVENLPKMLKIL